MKLSEGDSERDKTCVDVYFYSVLLLGACVFINFALTDPRLQQRNWSQQI